jgi:hypothetical protein
MVVPSFETAIGSYFPILLPAKYKFWSIVFTRGKSLDSELSA